MAQINKPNEYFNTKLYTGNGTGSSRSLTGVGFKPDFVWHKTRSSSGNHQLYDVVRGAGEVIQSDNTSAEATNLADGYLSSFDSDGFTMTDGASSDYYSNESGKTYVTWNWLAGGTASSNTDGSITSQVSANTTSGFSIVSFTGTGTDGDTVGHGLSQAPELVITKSRDDATHPWYTFGFPNNSAFATNGSNVKLNLTDAMIDSAVHEMSIGSSVITIDDSGQINGSGSRYIYYCFHSVKGFSKFGSYTGNGSTDGPFVYTGFRPAWVMVKRTDNVDDWQINDATRDSFNLVGKKLVANGSDAEVDNSNNSFDFLSNGFKARGSEAQTNASGGTYIYMAFAENPLVGTNNIPATAR